MPHRARPAAFAARVGDRVAANAHAVHVLDQHVFKGRFGKDREQRAGCPSELRSCRCSGQLGCHPVVQRDTCENVERESHAERAREKSLGVPYPRSCPLQYSLSFGSSL